jgi:predicted enzyme related to lactoylglutathione lyase
MVHRTRYADGEPCWADVTAPDVERATSFYGAVFGWTFEDADLGGYVTCRLAGRRVAGISPPAPGVERIPPAWSVYFAAHDLDAVAAKVPAAGGRVLLGPVEFPGSGRLLVGHDPTGAAFGLWEPGAHAGAEIYREPSALTWTELNTRDPVAGDAFYRALFGYEQRQIDGDGFDYSAWSLDGEEPVCGRMRMTADWAGIPPHWMPYFEVAETDTAIAAALATGGALRMGPFDSTHGRLAVLADPTEAIFTVLAI